MCLSSSREVYLSFLGFSGNLRLYENPKKEREALEKEEEEVGSWIDEEDSVLGRD